MSEAANTELNHELVISQLAAAALKGTVAVLTGEDEEVGPLLADVAVDLIDSTEVARLDAMDGHTAAAVVRALVVPLGIEPDDLIGVLRERAETLPLVLVVENAECLGSKALAAVKALMEKGRGGLGIVMGGTGELPGLLEHAGIEVASRQSAEGLSEASEHGGSAETPTESPLTALPWKHLGAILGLLLLVVLFWPGEEPKVDDAATDARPLKLPAPGEKSQQGSTQRDSGQPEMAEARPPEPQSPEREPESVQSPEADEPATSNEQVGEETSSGQADQGKVSVQSEPELSGLDAELAYRQEDWLLAQPDSRWVLQLTLAGTEDRARAVLDQLGRENGAYYRARRDGKHVYLVVAGLFSTREEALGGRSGLPESVRAAGPFPRSLADVQQEITASGKSSL